MSSHHHDDGSVWSNDGAICPYCCCKHEPCDSDGELYDVGTDTWECDHCDKEFVVSIHVEYSWDTRPTDDQQGGEA